MKISNSVLLSIIVLVSFFAWYFPRKSQSFPNTKFCGVKKYKISNPEDILFIDDSHFLTGNSNGEVIKVNINNSSMETILTAHDFNTNLLPGFICDGSYSKYQQCGRVLGIKSYGNDSVIMANAYFGIFKYNLTDKTLELLVEINTFVDDLVKLNNGDILFTEASHFYKFHEYIYAHLRNEAFGTIYQYSPSSDIIEEYLQFLYFPDGITIDEKFIYIAEVGTRSILISRKSTKKEVFIDDLPLYPDNIGINNGSLFVSGIERSHTLEFLVNHPILIEFILKITSPYIHLPIFYWLINKNGMFLEVDLRTRKIKRVFYDSTQKVFAATSSIIIKNDDYWVGSVMSNYVTKLTLCKQ